MLTASVPNLKAQDVTMGKLKKFFTNIAAYNSQYTQEKVYLHLDNNGYFPGETMWFKAYVVGAGSLLPTDMSKVLYVEVLTPEGELMERKTYPILNGRTCGEFHLDNVVHTGYYEVRAYTRALLNWDESYIFSRVIPIFDVPKDSLNYGKLSMYKSDDIFRRGVKRTADVPLVTDSTVKAEKCLLTFYPEGGYITQGLPCRVAFKLTDSQGLPLSSDCQLCKANGSAVASVKLVHEGMGLVEVPADWTGGFLSVPVANGKTARFSLPRARVASCDMRVLNNADGALTVQVRANQAFGAKTLGLSVTCRGVACFFDTLHVSSAWTNVRTIPHKELRNGVEQISLFTEEGEVIAERLAWVAPQKVQNIFTVAQSQDRYEPFSPIALNFTLKDGQGNPLQGEFSLAVHDEAGELAADGEDIYTDLLLSSDLKGYIHQPRYYFESNDAEHLQALDLLLMVQGWRRYSWKEMAGVRPFVLKEPVEDGLLVDGRVVDNSSKHVGKFGMNVNLMIMLGQSFVSGTAKTDSQGNFAFLAPKFYGTGVAYFTTTEGDKRKSCNVALNRGFSPTPMPYEPFALQGIDEKPEAVASTPLPATFTWNDTIPKIIHLPEVSVKEKQLLHPYGSRYTWMGGEETGKRFANLYYNVEDELESIFDQGEREPSLWDWLCKKNSNLIVEYDGDDPTHPILTYKGAPVELFIDNARPFAETDYLMGEIRSVVISEDPEVPRRLIDGYTNSSGRQPVSILLYSRLDQSLIKYKKGQRITLLHGYSKFEEFYSPNYRTSASPTSEDVRRTLYWNPNIVTDKHGKAGIVFFSNSRQQQKIRVNAQGVTVTGQFFGTK